VKILYVYEERIPLPLREMIVRRLTDAGFDLDYMTYATPTSDQCSKMRGADAVFFAPGRKLAREVLEAGRNVRLMQLWSSGYDKFDTQTCKELGIKVSNNGGANARAVAEHTITLVMCVQKWIPDSYRRTVEGKWAGNSHGIDMHLSKGMRLGIVGFGRIGSEVAKIASRGLEMEVVYYDIAGKDPLKEQQTGARYAEFREVLTSSDILTLHLHLSAQTRGMIGHDEIFSMKKDSVLVNVSRAELVNSKALLEALECGHLRGAALDVFEREPTPPNDPLLTHPHVVCTPHMAGSVFEAYVQAIDNAIANFKRLENNLPPRWVVNV
jgi:phosphoglycerate dehydrogenase-like enzyme